jgi:hypothetical protein
MATEYDIIEVFEITGRGAAVIIAETTDRSVREPHRVEVITPDGKVFKTEAYKEFLLRRNPTPVEKEGYLLKGLHKPDVPVGSRLRFVD